MKTLYTVIMGFIILEIKTPIPPNVGSGTQSYLLKFYQLGNEFIKNQ